MPRSIKKGPYVPPTLQKKLDKLNANNKKGTFKIWKRAIDITPDFIDHTFLIHNGKDFIPTCIVEDMVGHKLGEFSSTRTYKGHTTKGKK